MQLQIRFALTLLLMHGIAFATPVDRQVDAPRSRVTPNKMAVLGGPKTPVNKQSGTNGKTTNQSVQKIKNPSPKAAHL